MASSNSRKTSNTPAQAIQGTKSFAIVAVGASAGGLEAFTQLLRALPDNTGMGFVFVQHLDPHHPSILSELLAKATAMPVIEAKHGTAVKPNHVYVIPPNVNMIIRGRRLQLSPRSAQPGLHFPIDFFMRSLAEGRDGQSIGVILSGTGSDGTRGLTAIKAEGGLAFAQDDKSARHAGMPRSAIGSGCVDFILPPDEIGRELARISGHPYLSEPLASPPPAATKEPHTKQEGFERIFALLRASGGINFLQYKPGTVHRRTLRRMAIHKIEHVADYAKFLEKHPTEVDNLCQDLLIPVTSFFRDLEAFETLKNKIFPAILKDKYTRKAIRIWAPGCSTGEETYSLAMVLLEFLGDRAATFHIQLFGTDANERGIEKARTGVYQERIDQEISLDRMRRFFVKLDEGYRVTKGVRDLCVFAKQNLAEDPPFSHMNLVVCRNLLIYLGNEQQRKIFPVLHYSLRPTGFLMLGASESAASFPDLFAPVDKKHKIFAKKPTAAKLRYDFSANRYPRELSPVTHPREQTGTHSASTQLIEADRVVLAHHSPPGVIINANMEILQFRGSIGPYVEPSPGKASLHLLKLARRELVAELRTAVNQARKNQAPVKCKSVQFRRNGQSRSVNISVYPLAGLKENQEYLILFEPGVPPLSATGKPNRKLPETGKSGTEMRQLRGNLTAAEDHLRSLLESKEASDEEYQSANEEILSANEELQSTNEELETSKEELQSANEELNTVNDELHNRNIELDRSNSNLTNLLASTSLPVLMVDRALCIRLLTASSARILKVLPSDIGRSITDIRSNINVPNLEQLIKDVVDTLTPKEMEVRDDEGHWYSLQIRPYRTTDDKIDGAVIVLSDIDGLKRLTEWLAKSKGFMEDIMATVRQPLLVFDGHLTVLYANNSFLETFQVSPEETEGKVLYRLGKGEWDIPNLRARLEEVISKDSEMVDFEVNLDFPSLGTKTMLLNASRVEGGHTGGLTMLLAIEDITENKRAITERKAADKALREAHERLESLVEERTASVRRLSLKLLTVQDEEHRSIARDLHDSVGQQLANVKLNVDRLLQKEPKPTEAAQLSQLSKSVDQCMREIRTISHLLHPPMIDELGFSAAAKWYTEEFSDRSGIKVNLELPAGEQRLPRAVELPLFRILQASLGNVHRHTHSKSVDVRLEIIDGHGKLVVKDYGRGMSRERLEHFNLTGAGAGIGLTGMRERVRELGGKLEIQSEDTGTIVCATVPLAEHAQANKTG